MKNEAVSKQFSVLKILISSIARSFPQEPKISLIRTIWTIVFTPLSKSREYVIQFGLEPFVTLPVVLVARTVPAESSI
mgnify:CR=1 FL=1